MRQMGRFDLSLPSSCLQHDFIVDRPPIPPRLDTDLASVATEAIQVHTYTTVGPRNYRGRLRWVWLSPQPTELLWKDCRDCSPAEHTRLHATQDRHRSSETNHVSRGDAWPRMNHSCSNSSLAQPFPMMEMTCIHHFVVVLTTQPDFFEGFARVDMAWKVFSDLFASCGLRTLASKVPSLNVRTFPASHIAKPRQLRQSWKTPNQIPRPPYVTPSWTRQKCGVLRRMPMSTPPSVPAIGMVMIQEKASSPTRWKLTALSVPLHSPTPTVAPVIHMDVDTGSAYCEKMSTVMAAPISIEQPRDGEW
nr:hypothetical protein CFP56_36442 [Quercus suber]